MSKKFEYMSTNEWLGDATTHFMKSGEALRSPENKDQIELAKLIPREVNGVRVEYDISFDVKDICGYKFTDLLTKALFLSPQNKNICTEMMAKAASMPITDEGRHVFEMLRQNATDKYILHEEYDDCDEIQDLVILGGTNLLVKEDVLDLDKVDRLVRAGAHVKLHPITERTWVKSLRKRWGDQMIEPQVPLYPLIDAAKKIWFPTSSESGIVAALKKKAIGNIDHPDKKTGSNFQPIYRGIDRAKEGPNKTIAERFAAILSHPLSGIVTTYHENPKARVEAYFAYTSEHYEHRR